MAATFHGETAKIFAFPGRERPDNSSGVRTGKARLGTFGSVRRSVIEFPQPARPEPVIIGNWYHEAAIEEARHTVKS